jgi:CheY-like chemotaxis protein
MGNDGIELGNITSNHGGVEVLVVDDDPAMQELISDFLEGLGYVTVGFNSPLVVLEYVRRQQSLGLGVRRLIITDCNMPHMGGLELIDSLRMIAPDTPAVLISAFGGEQVDCDVLDREDLLFLQKPFPLPDLAKMVSQGEAQIH